MTRSQYDGLIRDLMYEDPNGSWNEILGECGGDVGEAVVVLRMDVQAAFDRAICPPEIYVSVMNRIDSNRQTQTL